MEEDSTQEGYLQRRSRLKLCSWWKTGWFVLRGKTLSCFKNEEQSREAKDDGSKTFLNLNQVQVVRAATSESYNGRFVMELVTNFGSIVKLAASDVESRKCWLSWFHRALDLPSVSLPLSLAPPPPTPTATTPSVRMSEYWNQPKHLSLNLCDEVLQQIQFQNESSSSSRIAEEEDKVTQTDFSSPSSDTD